MKHMKQGRYIRMILFMAVLFMIHTGTGYADTLDWSVSASRGTLDDRVVIAWEPVKCATGYVVYRSDNYHGPYCVAGKLKKDDRMYTDTDVDGGHYYWYRVVPCYWVFLGDVSSRVQGWIKPRMAGGMVNTLDRIAGILEQVPHAYNVKGLADNRLKTLPEPDMGAVSVPDNDTIYAWLEKICTTDHRRIGSPESGQAIAYIKRILGEMPEMEVYDDPIELDAVYRADTWGVDIETDHGPETLDAFYTVNTGMTLDHPHGGTVTGDMVWAGDGRPEAFDDLGDISDKVVVALCEFPDLPIGLISFLFDGGYGQSDPEGWMGLFTSVPMTFARSNFPPEYDGEPYAESVYWQASWRGAAGLILVMKNHPGDTNTHWGPYDGRMRAMPCFWVSSYQEEEITAYAQSGFPATLTLEGEVAPGEGHNIYAILPGQSDEIILVSSHHDSCHKGATEDGTGVSMVLAQADIWSRVPRASREKTLVFSLTDGHHYRGIGAQKFAHDHMDDIMKKTIIDINLEHLAAKDAEDNGLGQLVPTDRGAMTLIFVNESPTAIATAARMLATMSPAPDRTLEIQSTLLGDVPPGEAGHFHIAAGIDFIHWIGSPPYLLTAEDTLDKVDKDLLNPLAESVARMVGTYMRIPEGYSDYE